MVAAAATTFRAFIYPSSARFKAVYSSSFLLSSPLSFFSSSSVALRCTQPNLAAIESPSVHQQVNQRPNVIEILEKRGLLDSITNDNLRLSCTDPARPPLRVYCGFEPTAESLHLGNLLGIIVLSWFLRCGHSAVALIGGATGRIGDPSGKSTERPELDSLTLERNIAGISATTRRILGRIPVADTNIAILNNYDWWKDVKLLDFLKDVGKYARIGTMMSKESVRKRLESEQGISYIEFTYQLLQGYDFLHLFQNEGINVQIGSDVTPRTRHTA